MNTGTSCRISTARTRTRKANHCCRSVDHDGAVVDDGVRRDDLPHGRGRIKTITTMEGKTAPLRDNSIKMLGQAT